MSPFLFLSLPLFIVVTAGRNTGMHWHGDSNDDGFRRQHDLGDPPGDAGGSDRGHSGAPLPEESGVHQG